MSNIHFPGAAALAEKMRLALADPPEVRWVSDIAFEGAATDDGRYILPGALDWRELPLSLMALTETGPGGHEGAFLAGKILKIRRDRSYDMDGDPLDDGAVAIRGEGVFDMQGDNGAEVARLVADETLRGVSIDMAVHETMLRDQATGELIDPDEAGEEDLARMFTDDLQFAVRRGTILAATVCPTPAFANARIALAASGEKVLRLEVPFRIVTESVTAAAAGLAPELPPRAWFDQPELNQPTPLTVTDDGQVYGHIAAWDSCHTGKQGICFRPPSSPSHYAYFNLGEVICDDGSRVSVGQITLGTDHAPLSATSRGTKAHYENTGVCVADVRATDGRHGIWVSGAVRPNVTQEQARELMGSKPSGDWRAMTPGGPLELIGILAVNVPGYPVPRPEARLVASAEHPEGEVVALTASVEVVTEQELDGRLAVLMARAEGTDEIEALAELAGV